MVDRFQRVLLTTLGFRPQRETEGRAVDVDQGSSPKKQRRYRSTLGGGPVSVGETYDAGEGLVAGEFRSLRCGGEGEGEGRQNGWDVWRSNSWIDVKKMSRQTETG